ncbi:hypothetical protein TrST_g10224 [Triparma strigata]|uniref:CID domain-containing protein n=1 Tax=Triparma strigata TaxID=1606541 RepID=A0A9W7AIU2_9STRA|nr:hypothetical protein TrST_g10224 [Triparma strigata]
MSPPSPSSSSIDDDSIDEAELATDVTSFKSLLKSLGGHPDKKIINSLTMLCEDYNTSPSASSQLYNLIRTSLLNSSTPSSHKLPLIYLLDSMLHNADDVSSKLYKKLISGEVKLVYNSVWNSVEEKDKKRLQRLAGIWEKNEMFDKEIMEDVMSHQLEEEVGVKDDSDGVVDLAKLDENVRSEMERMLQQMQSEMGESNPVTLLELSKINPSLVSGLHSQAVSTISTSPPPPPPDSWSSVSINFSSCSTLIKNLDSILLNNPSPPLGPALAASKIYLQTVVKAYKSGELLKSISAVSALESVSVLDDLLEFNSDNVKVYDKRVVEGLYGGGMKFWGRGRRFRTMGECREWEMYEEEGGRKWEESWLEDAETWMSALELDPTAEVEQEEEEESIIIDTSPADESRPLCRICGKKFSTFYDDEEGVYMFNDCREVEIIEEVEGVREEKVYVHGTCCGNLGIEREEGVERRHVLDL